MRNNSLVEDNRTSFCSRSCRESLCKQLKGIASMNVPHIVTVCLYNLSLLSICPCYLSCNLSQFDTSCIIIVDFIPKIVLCARSRSEVICCYLTVKECIRNCSFSQFVNCCTQSKKSSCCSIAAAEFTGSDVLNAR